MTIEINSVNTTSDIPNRKRGVGLRSASEPENITQILQTRLSELTKSMDEANPLDPKDTAKDRAVIPKLFKSETINYEKEDPELFHCFRKSQDEFYQIRLYLPCQLHEYRCWRVIIPMS